MRRVFKRISIDVCPDPEQSLTCDFKYRRELGCKIEFNSFRVSSVLLVTRKALETKAFNCAPDFLVYIEELI